jgi:hypothetical protein
MQPLDELWEERAHRFVDELLKVARRLLVIEVEPELFGDGEHLDLPTQVLDLRIDHEHEQVEDQVGLRPQDVEGLSA